MKIEYVVCGEEKTKKLQKEPKNRGKCKLLYSKSEEKLFGSKILSSVYLTKSGAIKVVRCNDASMFSECALRLLVPDNKVCDIKAVTVYSITENVPTVRVALICAENKKLHTDILSALAHDIKTEGESNL